MNYNLLCAALPGEKKLRYMTDEEFERAYDESSKLIAKAENGSQSMSLSGKEVARKVKGALFGKSSQDKPLKEILSPFKKK
jgi:hypothetical protein